MAVNCENISPTFLFCEFILLQRFLNILQGLHPNNPTEKSVCIHTQRSVGYVGHFDSFGVCKTLILSTIMRF